MYSSTKDSQPSGDEWGQQASKLPPWLPVPCSPGKSILEPEQSLFCPKMMLKCLSACFLPNWSSCKCHHQKKLRRGAQIHKIGSGTRSLAYTSSEEGSASDIGIFLGDVTNPKVNHLRISLGLLALHQPVTACGSSRWCKEDGHADPPAS